MSSFDRETTSYTCPSGQRLFNCGHWAAWRNTYGGYGTTTNCQPKGSGRMWATGTCFKETSCSAGQYRSGASCKDCPTNKYGGGGTSTSCSSCPSGKGTAGETKRTTYSDCFCGSGKYYHGHPYNSCRSCPTGYFSSNKSDSCSACPHGKTTTGTGRSSADYCYCKPGLYLSGGQCIGCPQNKYSGVGDSCSSCPSGKGTGGRTAQTSPNDCYCNAGTAWNGRQCVTCGANKYSSATSNSCSSCASGKYTNGKTGQSSCENTPSPTRTPTRTPTKHPTGTPTSSHPTKPGCWVHITDGYCKSNQNHVALADFIPDIYGREHFNTYYDRNACLTHRRNQYKSYCGVHQNKVIMIWNDPCAADVESESQAAFDEIRNNAAQNHGKKISFSNFGWKEAASKCSTGASSVRHKRRKVFTDLVKRIANFLVDVEEAGMPAKFVNRAKGKYEMKVQRARKNKTKRNSPSGKVQCEEADVDLRLEGAYDVVLDEAGDSALACLGKRPIANMDFVSEGVYNKKCWNREAGLWGPVTEVRDGDEFACSGYDFF